MKRPRAWWEYMPADVIEPPRIEVDPDAPVYTGLVDKDGRRIMRGPLPIGFPITGRRT